MEALRSIRVAMSKRRLLVALCGAVVVALGLVGASLYLYERDDVSRLDVSSPKYEKIRKAVMSDANPDMFGGTGSLGTGDIAKFQAIFDAKRKSLGSFGKFEDSLLSDEQLKFTPVE